MKVPNLFKVDGKIGVYIRNSTLYRHINKKTALVTGGGSGIGRMIAEGLVTNGAKVYIAARKEKQLKEVEYLM